MALTESEIRVIIAAEVRKAGFDKAAKQASFLEKQFKKLGGTLLAVFSTQKVIAFGKASVKAFAEDEKAARRLTQTLASMNLAFEDPRISAFIASVEQQTGVLDDKLRPAMEGLLRTTGSVIQSQKLLALAIDVAAGSGVDLETVASDLSRAYVGNTRGLIKYNLGLTKTELAAKSFLEVQQLLTDQYMGQNAAFLETYEGKVNLLRVAYANMQETIGKGLVDAFARLAGNEGIPSATAAMEKFATQVSDTINGVAILIGYLKSIPGAGLLLKNLDMSNFGILGVLQSLGANNRKAPKPFSIPMTVSGQTDLYKKQDKARAKAEADAAKRAKELDALRKKQETERLKREKLLAAQKRAQTIFDMENIQIVAAMQGRIDGEQRMRLTALLALNTENFVAAEKLTDIIVRLNAPALANLGVMMQAGDTIDDVIKKLITSQAKLAGLQLMAEDFPMPDNIFEEWETSLENILEMLMQMLALLAGTSPSKMKTGIYSVDAYGFSSPEAYRNYRSGERGDVFSNSQALDYSKLALGGSTRGEYSSYTPSMNPGVNVNIQVAGNVTTERDLVTSITNALYQTQKDGNSILYSSTAI
jgi:hypothetical protein